MTKEECLKTIERISKEMESLPKGYISRKEIGKSVYFYHQWTEDGIKKADILLPIS